MLSATRGLTVDADNVLVTRGSQMALVLVARGLLRPGDAVAVEHPGYRPAWEAIKLAGAEILPVPVDDNGLDIGALQQIIARQPIRALYLTPHHQFPTTVTLTAPRRAALLQLAARHRFAIVEDDYDHEFHYSGNPVTPLASADEAGVVIYIGTMSKILAPGIRVGFIAASRDLIAHLLAYRSVLDLQGDQALEHAVAELLEEGLVQRHVRKMRRLYRQRLHALVSELRAQLAGFLTFDRPSGGTAIWVRLHDPRTLKPWINAARRVGVVFDAGDSFTLGDAVPGARLGFASLSENELRTAASRLALAAEEALSRVTGSRAQPRETRVVSVE
jgi:GntR family transcriptional regulator/MocR family aminotransferase